MRATGVGSMPGEDFADAFHIVLGEVGDLPYVPELPARGVSAGMIGRTVALFDDLAVDLQPAGWRLTSATGRDQRRTRSLLGHDLDLVEELLPASAPALKQQLAGPLTLASAIERPRGDRVLADHGARREIAESLASGVALHVADLRKRAPHADIVVQVDEPSLPAVLAGAIPTASGYGRHRTVDLPEADRLLRLLTGAIEDAGATPIVHCCASEVPVALLQGAGFRAISFDLSLVGPSETWAKAFEHGVNVWPGGAEDRHAIDSWFRSLGFDDARYGDRTVLTPACGLAGMSPAQARRVLSATQRLAAGL